VWAWRVLGLSRLFGDGYGIVGCRIEVMCGRGWVSCFALEYVEMVGVVPLYEGLTRFTSEVGCGDACGGFILGLSRVEDVWFLDGGHCVGW